MGSTTPPITSRSFGSARHRIVSRLRMRRRRCLPLFCFIVFSLFKLKRPGRCGQPLKDLLRQGACPSGDETDSMFFLLGEPCPLPRDRHLQALAELERRGLLEGDLDQQHPGVRGAAGVLRLEAPADDGVQDLLDGGFPGLADVALGGDGDGEAPASTDSPRQEQGSPSSCTARAGRGAAAKTSRQSASPRRLFSVNLIEILHCDVFYNLRRDLPWSAFSMCVAPASV